MSKGPGKQQRRILAALEKHPVFFLAELPHSGRTEMVSLLRAAWKLCDARKIDIWTYNFHHRVVVCRVGHKPASRPSNDRFISVEPSTQVMLPEIVQSPPRRTEGNQSLRNLRKEKGYLQR